MKEKNLIKILHNIYIEVYKNSTPSADWEKLLSEAPIDENGRKVIDFNSYECEEEVMKKILENNFKKHKLKEYDRKRISVSFYLGASPKTKK